MLKGTSRLFFSLMVVCLAVAPSHAQEAAVLEAPTATELQLASVFTDHMVLQRERSIPIWGNASPGKTVSVATRRAKTRGYSRRKWQMASQLSRFASRRAA